jgi:hypothetical protein
MRVVSGLCSAAFLALSALALPARAQNPAAAEALFEEARAAMAEGSYDVACARFRDSDKLDPAVGTRFNLADCEERRGRLATAWSAFRGVAAELGPEDDRKPIAEERAKALESRLPYVTLKRTAMTPPGVRVRIDGAEIGEASIGIALPMDPGAHELVVQAPGAAEEQRASFTLQEGQHASLPVRLRLKAKPAESAPAVSAPQTDEPPSSPGSTSSRRVWAYVAGGVGLAGVAEGAVSGVVTLNKKKTADDNCNDGTKRCNQTGLDANSSGRVFAVASSVGFGVGVVGLATAVYLWLTEPPDAGLGARPSSAERRRMRESGVILSGGVGWSQTSGFVSLSGAF